MISVISAAWQVPSHTLERDGDGDDAYDDVVDTVIFGIGIGTEPTTTDTFCPIGKSTRA